MGLLDRVFLLRIKRKECKREVLLTGYFNRKDTLKLANKLPKIRIEVGKNAVLRILWSILKSALANVDLKFKGYIGRLQCYMKSFC